MPLSWRFRYLFALERMDEWVLTVSIAIPVICVSALLLWHVGSYLAGKLFPKRKTYRHALEPRPPMQFPRGETGEPAVARTTRALHQFAGQIKDDPEQLQRLCTSLEESLAEIYLELAESCSRQGRSEQAAAALQRIIQSFPESRHVQAAQDRLEVMSRGAPPV